jgi:excinuclease UvrABC ATPase subunit
MKSSVDCLPVEGGDEICRDSISPTLAAKHSGASGADLISRLEDMLHILDEPTIGQHPADVQHLLPAFRELAGPVVFVEHDRQAAAEADWAIDLGPGAGWQGGEVVFEGKPEALWQADTITGRSFQPASGCSLSDPSRRPSGSW